jgi:hypothetical protein
MVVIDHYTRTGVVCYACCVLMISIGGTCRHGHFAWFWWEMTHDVRTGNRLHKVNDEKAREQAILQKTREEVSGSFSNSKTREYFEICITNKQLDCNISRHDEILQYPACQRYENPASRTFFVSTRCLPYPLDNWCCEDCSAVRSVRFVCIAFIPLRTLQETTVPSIKMDSSADKPAMSTALIGTAVLVVLFTTLVLQIKPVHRAVTASFSRLRLLIMTNVHIPERRPRSRSRSLSNQSLVQVSHLFIHPGKLLQYIQCRLFCHVKLVVVFYDVFYGNFTRHH